MRLTRFLTEKDNISKGLSINEPEVGEKYSDEEVKKNITAIKDAINSQKSNGTESDADESIIKDLEDKLNKWENVDIETEPVGPVVPAVDVLAAQPPEGEGDAAKEEPKEEEEEDKKKTPPEDDEEGQEEAEKKAAKVRKK